ncbi:hypothetical protein ANANG_G00146300 [Anguilla anguilla]|uniref:Uncharacterized protein n=1 Tax=Anguilla anguilla TaxID=7936 RepID=A0A9D3MHJ9_ANGAN|nr:hypothetical protein ANANG_G00146300 [Anguilla anguilla]
MCHPKDTSVIQLRSGTFVKARLCSARENGGRASAACELPVRQTELPLTRISFHRTVHLGDRMKNRPLHVC